MSRKLTGKQRAFIDEYFLTDFNGVKAAKNAGYKGEYFTLAAIASENLKKPKIAKEISRRFAARAMSADEALARLGEQGRVSIADFIRTDNEGAGIDWDAVKEKGHLIKSLTPTRYGWRLELHDAQAAIVHIGRHHKLFTDKVEHTGEVQSRVEHDISGDTAETIFDILASVSAIKPALNDAEDDEVHTASTN